MISVSLRQGFFVILHRLAPCAAGLLCGLPPQTNAQVSPHLPDAPKVVLHANRLTGPAPLAVLFDATATSAPGIEFPFHHLLYHFDFDDPKSGNWAVSGLPKNVQEGGPLAAHVFDRPGLYKVRVRAQKPGGPSSSAQIEIAVQDPAKIYAGSRTVCVSSSGDFTGCPPGATRRTTLPDTFSGSRVLLRRGESFGAIRPRAEEHDFQIGAYGEGAKPQVEGVGTGRPGEGGKVPQNWTVMDLDIGGGAVEIEASTIGFLLYRNDITRYHNSASMINIGTAAGYYQSRGYELLCWPREVFLVENTVRGKVPREKEEAAPNLVAMGWFFQSAILGNRMDCAREHTLRIWAADKAVIAHNALGGNHLAASDGIGIRSALKLHSSGTQPWTELVAASPLVRTSKVVLASNTIGSPTFPGSWLSGMGPQNADPGTVEALEDCLAENNLYIRGPESRSFKSELQLRGRRMTARGNTLQGGGIPHIARGGANFDSALDPWDGPYFLEK